MEDKIMKNLTPELVAKAKAAKSAEELLELAKVNDVELTDEEAKICFEQLHANGAVSDDELEAVAGGGGCEFFEDFFRSKNMLNESNCPYCDDKPKTPNLLDKPTVDSGMISIPSDPKAKNKIVFL